MRKFIIIILLYSCLFIGCKTDQKIMENENLDKVDNAIDNSIDDTYFIEIGALEFKDKVYSEDKYLFFIGRDTCPACKNFKPIIRKFASDKKINVYYVNSTDFENSDWDIIDSIATIEYIPTILISSNGLVLYNEHGSKTYEDLETIIEKYMK